MRALYTHPGASFHERHNLSLGRCLFINYSLTIIIFIFIIIYYVRNIAFPLKMLCPQSILMEDLSLALDCNIVSLFFIPKLVIVEDL
jgi:hypothetical protein